jgi:hypothetical protein
MYIPHYTHIDIDKNLFAFFLPGGMQFYSSTNFITSYDSFLEFVASRVHEINKRYDIAPTS